MLLPTSSILRHPSALKLHPSPFLHGSCPFPLHPKAPRTTTAASPSSLTFTVQAMKKMQGRVVCATNDKTVSVEVVRLTPHPRYKRLYRRKKKYQAHDPDNRFKVGDVVQLESSRPISKTKTFIAVPLVSTHRPKSVEDVPAELGLPLQSQQELEDVSA